MMGSKVFQWSEVQGSAGELPVGPVKTDASAAELTLIPYGAAKLRVTAFRKFCDTEWNSIATFSPNPTRN
jgi:hypothetical protein